MIKMTLLTTSPSKIASDLLFAMLIVFSLNNTPAQAEEPRLTGQLPQSFSHLISKTVTNNYLLYLPAAYAADRERRWPLIIFLHGSGERGDDLSKIKVNGLPKMLESERNFPFIVVSPQVPLEGNWDVDVLDALLDDVLERLPVDPDRVYLTGLSMGGYATWNWATQRPERFAAIAPVCGIGSRYRACRLLNVPVWAFHGDHDSVVSFKEDELMVKAVQSCGGEAQLTTYTGGGHDAWTETYANPQLYNWFLQHQRGLLQK